MYNSNEKANRENMTPKIMRFKLKRKMRRPMIKRKAERCRKQGNNETTHLINNLSTLWKNKIWILACVLGLRCCD